MHIFILKVRTYLLFCFTILKHTYIVVIYAIHEVYINMEKYKEHNVTYLIFFFNLKFKNVVLNYQSTLHIICI